MMQKLLDRWARMGKARWILGSGVAASAIFAATLVPVLAAPSAADPTPAATATVVQPDQQAKGNHQRLEKLLQREQKELAQGQKVLDRANNVISKIQDRINNLNSKGQNSSSLQAALSGFQNDVNSAQSSYNSAKGILDTHAGFDGNGHVTDVAQARNTLTTARKAMLQFRQAARRATSDFRTARSHLTQENRLAREQKQLTVEQKRLDRANKMATNIQSLIDKQKSKGKDTSTVETALAAFKAAIGSAQSSYNSASSTLNSHAGFDGNGQVTDAAQAKDTLQSVAKDFQQLNHTLGQAGKQLRQAIKDFRTANKAKA